MKNALFRPLTEFVFKSVAVKVLVSKALDALTSRGSLSFERPPAFRDDERALLSRTTLLGLRPAVLTSSGFVERAVGGTDRLKRGGEAATRALPFQSAEGIWLISGRPRVHC